MLVTIGGVIPDIDGLGAIPQFLTRNMEKPMTFFSDYHHIISHNIGAFFVVVILAVSIANNRIKTGLLVLFTFHLHLLCDIIGARGPDGYQWPIPYLLPFSSEWQLTWSHQWDLNAWPNFLITIIAIAITFMLAWKRGYSILELVYSRADATFVGALRRRFPGMDAS